MNRKEVNKKRYIGRKFSLQVYRELYKDVYGSLAPMSGWAVDCDGARVYIDEHGYMLMDAVLPDKLGRMIKGYGCVKAWTVEE